MMAIEVSVAADEVGIILRTKDALRLAFLYLAPADCCDGVVAQRCIGLVVERTALFAVDCESERVRESFCNVIATSA